ncbi:Gfo/Idh/MocA family protein [Heyndrickxia acidicola]|uniref:Gfo/Idh/MocA family oxidoreductase n=1 Tax=Heyndrickxia acidicola TaxID=209389 RepID=A0ABU6MEH9_9BACI|nr:Gfo/Idh/MocA family oxidoreductase [Heyndrickxia acidicola]MED1203056.1 Gfo/Idh/MocA family oxidoreductase [Heyndrickxia acidicola]
MLKVAVIGLGDISGIHLAAIQANPNAYLAAVCDINEGLKNGFDPKVNFYTDYQQMLESEALDCVHVCLPHYLHYPVTKACVEKGVHVIQEKPLALNTDEGMELLKLEEENSNVKICVCFQNRYNESFETLLKIARKGIYGTVLGVKGLVTWFRPREYYEAKPWRGIMKYAGGGVMINQSIHTLDLMQLLGGDIEDIRGTISQLLQYDIEVEDTASSHIQFKNGARGLFFATIANAENSSVELEILFEKAKFSIKDSILTRIHENGEREDLAEDIKLPGSKFYYGASHVKLINRFYDCIIQNAHDYVHVKDALPSIKMIDAIRKSSEQKKEIIMEVF